MAAVDSLATIGSVVDVLTFHSYHSSWELGLQRTEFALSIARAQKKPVFNSETGCIARANAFDQTMEMAIRNGIGFAVWELMISDCLDCIDTRRWKHGLMFRDGTTRDPSAIAALRGSGTLILKPSDGTQGDGIFLVRSTTELERLLADWARLNCTW